jgi:hypothetical protein
VARRERKFEVVDAFHHQSGELARLLKASITIRNDRLLLKAPCKGAINVSPLGQRQAAPRGE